MDFIAQKNTVRAWYHAPWMHTGQNARDFVRGLTNERQSQPYELSSTQDKRYKNAAIGFYNDLGGYTIGQVCLLADCMREAETWCCNLLRVAGCCTSVFGCCQTARATASNLRVCLHA